MKHKGDRRAFETIAMAIVLLSLACSSRHRLGRLESDETVGASGSQGTGDGGTANGGPHAANGGTSADSNGDAHAGEHAAGGATPPRLPPDVFVAH